MKRINLLLVVTVALLISGCRGRLLEEQELMKVGNDLLGYWYKINMQFSSQQEALEYAQMYPDYYDWSETAFEHEVAHGDKTPMSQLGFFDGWHFLGTYDDIFLCEVGEAPYAVSADLISVKLNSYVTLHKDNQGYLFVAESYRGNYVYHICLLEDNKMVLRINDKYLLFYRGQSLDERNKLLREETKYYLSRNWYIKEMTTTIGEEERIKHFSDTYFAIRCDSVRYVNMYPLPTNFNLCPGTYNEQTGYIQDPDKSLIGGSVGYYNISAGAVYYTITGAKYLDENVKSQLDKTIYHNVFLLNRLTENSFTATGIRYDEDSTKITTTYYFEGFEKQQ